MGHGHQRRARAAARQGEEANEIVKLLRGVTSSTGHSMHVVWRDWIAAMATAISNAVDRRQPVWNEREAEYMAVVKRYGTKAGEVMDVFAQCKAMVVDALELEPRDLLGGLYMALELGNDAAGQFFTPYRVCLTMARMLVTDRAELDAMIRARGYIAASEPAIGGGAMVVAFAEVLRELGVDPTTQLHVTGVDVDRAVLQQAYVQLSLLGVPGVLVVGNALTLEEREHWYTPMHVFGCWDTRRKLERVVEHVREAVDAEGHRPAQLVLEV